MTTVLRRCIAVVLRPRLAIARDLKWPLKAFVIGDQRFCDTGIGNFTGFYDWLRGGDRGILGVRYWLNDETTFIANLTERLPYVRVDPPNSIEIYFSDRRDVDPQISADQEFLYDAIFRSDYGEVAICFGVEALAPDEIRGLEFPNVESLSVQVTE